MKETILRDKQFHKEKFILLILKKKNKIKEGKSWRKDPHLCHIIPALIPQNIKLQIRKEFTIKTLSEIKEEMELPAPYFDNLYFYIFGKYFEDELHFFKFGYNFISHRSQDF